MASKASHLALARHNQDTIDHLSTSEAFADWIATVAFYKALHLVDALLADIPDVAHGRNHGYRSRVLKKDNRFRNIWKHYRPLKTASEVARYLRDDENNGGYGCFEDYLSLERVKSEIVGFRLTELEKSVKRLLKH